MLVGSILFIMMLSKCWEDLEGEEAMTLVSGIGAHLSLILVLDVILALCVNFPEGEVEDEGSHDATSEQKKKSKKVCLCLYCYTQVPLYVIVWCVVLVHDVTVD